MRKLFLTAAAVLVAVAACGSTETVTVAADEPDSAFAARAREVADAWRTARDEPANDRWRTGFVPLQRLTVPPAGVTGDLQVALTHGWYRLRATLPNDTPAPSAVRFPDGSTLSTRLVSARAAYDAMHLSDPPCAEPAGSPTPPAASGPDGPVGGPTTQTCAVLTVTGATLDTVRLRTSRGLATVPAWRFTVAELPEPVAQVAVAPAAVSATPHPAVPPMAPDLAAASEATLTGAASLAYQIGIGACHRNPRGFSYETDDVVVIGGAADPPVGDAPCIGSLALPVVDVVLERALGDRVLLDAGTGRPLQLIASR